MNNTINWHAENVMGTDVEMGLNKQFNYSVIENHIANYIIQRLIYSKAYGQELTIYFEHGCDAEIGIVKMLIDEMNKYKEQGVLINTRATGTLGSGTSLLFLNGSVGKREMAPNAKLVLDGVTVEDFSGNIIEFKEKIKEIQEDNSFIIKTVKENLQDKILINRIEKAIHHGDTIKITAQNLYEKNEVVII